jgi:hypothetical protein
VLPKHLRIGVIIETLIIHHGHAIVPSLRAHRIIQ